MNFSDLPVGARFRFFRRGLRLTKTSQGSYTTHPGAGEQKSGPDVEVLPEDKDALAPVPRAATKPDDVALLSKALDDLETHAGKTLELAAARQALRRLAALGKLKSES
jgi:hypothetical protein